jgi:hypothetical protein
MKGALSLVVLLLAIAPSALAQRVLVVPIGRGLYTTIPVAPQEGHNDYVLPQGGGVVIVPPPGPADDPPDPGAPQFAPQSQQHLGPQPGSR